MDLLAHVTASGPEHEVRSPATGEVLVRLRHSTSADVRAAVAAARAVQADWAARDARRRARVLLDLHDAVLDRQREVLDLLQLETGKTRASAYEEVGGIALVARHYARRGPAYLAPRRVPGLIPGLTRVEVHRRPRGVVGVLAPWNYPLMLSLGDAIPALVAGNAVVLKPDPQTVQTTAWGLELLAAASLPAGLAQLVVGGGEIGAAVVDAVDHVVFTGSSTTGRLVGERAGRRLISATLELGGKNAFYVTDDADPRHAAEAAVRTCFTNTGQLCVSAERLVLQEGVAEAFLAQFLPRVRALRLGTALDYGADLGSLTTPGQLAVVATHVSDALARGATLLAGGRPRPDVGPLCFEPTVLAEVPAEAAMAAAETFGPVVAVYRVADDDAAIELINDSEYGLAATVWTGDPARGRRIAARLEVGAVSINEGYQAFWGSVAAPVGGVKASGLGRRNGADGVLATTWAQTVVRQRGAHRGLGLRLLFERSAHRWTSLFTRSLRLLRVLRRP